MTMQTKLIGNLDGSLTVVSKQDDKVLKELSNVNSTEKFKNGRSSYAGDSQFSHRVARIPMIVVEKMMREGIWGNQERMKEWLNHADNKYWRTTVGKL